MSRKRRGFPKGFDPDAPKAPLTVVKTPKVRATKKIRIRRPLAPRPPAAKVEKFLSAGRKFQWKPGQSGNPAGARSRKGVKIRDYKSFVEDCRELSPRALARLREAIELPWAKESARTILTACALILERGYGRAVAITVDASPPQVAPVIEMDDAYWADLTRALKESGALEIPVNAPGEKPDEDVVDAEVKLIEPPRC